MNQHKLKGSRDVILILNKACFKMKKGLKRIKIFQLLTDTIYDECITFMKLHALHNPASDQKVKSVNIQRENSWNVYYFTDQSTSKYYRENS